MTNHASDNTPVAILGGGLAGLLAAYRLGKAGQAVDLYEASHRFGGRIWTETDFHNGHYAERGAELVDTAHETLLALIEELGLQVENVPHQPSSVPYLLQRGQTKTVEEVFGGTPPVYHIWRESLQERVSIAASTAYQSDGTLTEEGKRLDALSIHDWLQQQTDILPTETLELLEQAYVSEMGARADQQSALNFILLFGQNSAQFELYGRSNEALRVVGGSQRIIDALLEQLSTMPHVHLHASSPVTALQRTEDGTIQLDIAGQSTQPYEDILCSIPFSVLRDIPGIETLDLSESKQDAIQQLTYGQNTKVILPVKGFPWQNRDGQEANVGAYVSDHGAIQVFWNTAMTPNATDGIVTILLGGEYALSTPQFQVTVARIYLSQLWNLPEEAIFYPETAPVINEQAYDPQTRAPLVMQWGNMPYAKGSYVSLSVGQYHHMLPHIDTPEQDGHWRTIGEAAGGDWIGFMEGAALSAEREVAQLLQQRQDRNTTLSSAADAHVCDGCHTQNHRAASSRQSI